MQINKSSWHYKFYNKTYTIWNNDPPEQTNFCQYFRRIFLTILFSPLMAIVALILAFGVLVMCVIANTFLLSFGWYSNLAIEFKRYNKLTIGKFSFYPWVITIPLFFIWLHYILYVHTNHGFRNLSIADIITISIALIVGTVIILRKGETYKLIKAYWIANKEKVCPLVEFK